jgi:hypothetical protein
MNQQKLEDIVSHIDYLVSELKHLKSKITMEDGLHFNVISNGEIFAIELWDTELLEPRILSYKPASMPRDLIKECQKALDSIACSPRAMRKQLYWNSDISWDELPELYRKLDQVYKIEKRELSEHLRDEVTGRVNALYNV